jgi:hypothetical protein
MTSLYSLTAALGDAARESSATSSSPVSALYPSAGRDTYPPTLTALAHLLRIGASSAD